MVLRQRASKPRSPSLTTQPTRLIPFPWRRDYYANFKKLPKNAKRHPADRTIQYDMMIGKAIIRWAHEQGLRGKQTLPTVTFTPKKKRVRPAFELSEFRILWRVLCRRIQTARDKRIRTSRDLFRLAKLSTPWQANNRSITQRDPTGH